MTDDVKLEAVAAVCRESHNTGLMWVSQSHPPTGTQLCTLESAQQAVANARRTAEYWKEEHLAGNKRITALETALRQAVDALEMLKAMGATTPQAFNAITAGKEALK